MSSPSKEKIQKRLMADFLTGRIMDNSLRGYWCEAMVAEALGSSCAIISYGWHPWDLQLGPSKAKFPERIRIQVKNSARLQTWNAATGILSDCQFNLKYGRRNDYFEKDNPNVPCEEHGFMCDVFVLCHHPIEDADLADQTNPKQWEFFVLPVIGKNCAVTPTELAAADEACRGSGKPSNCQRRPETLPKGIRGRLPVHPIPIEKLSLATIRQSLGI